MSSHPPQPRPRCFYCDELLDDEQARIALPRGQVFGPCCEDVAPEGKSPTCRRARPALGRTPLPEVVRKKLD